MNRKIVFDILLDSMNGHTSLKATTSLLYPDKKNNNGGVEKGKYTIKNEQKLWIETSIETKTLNISKLARVLAHRTDKSVDAWKLKYYRWAKKGFTDLWYDKFKEHFRKKIGVKVYNKLDDLVDKSKNIRDLVAVGEFLEGRDKIGVMVNIKNEFQKEKDEYIMGEED